jgi:hypothetical protein
MSSTEQQIDDAVAKRHVQGSDSGLGTQSADLDMNLHKIIGLEDPTGDKDAAHKKYVDDNIGPGSGDVEGPASATDNAIPVFDGITGTKIKDSTRVIEDTMSDGDDIPDGHAIKVHGDANWSGDVVGPATHSADYVPQWSSTPDGKILVEGLPITTEGKAILASALVKIYTQAEKDKLTAIEGSADVTDATNVAAAGAVMDSDFAAINELMKGTGAGTHDQLVVAASRIVGRAAAGNIDDLTAAQVKTILGFIAPILDKDAPGTLGTSTPSTVYSNYLRMSGEASFVLQVHSSITGAETINWQNGNKHKMTFGAGNATLSFTAPHNSAGLILIIIQDGTGGRTITWPGTVKWPGGTAPTLSTGANAIDVIGFIYEGSYYLGQYGNNSLDFS